MFTNLDPTFDLYARDQRERLAGFVQARRTKFRVPRRKPLKLPAQRRNPAIEI